MRILRSAEARLRTSAAGVQQTAMYSVQAEFGLLAASLYRQLDPAMASKYTVLREMTIGETLHTLPVSRQRFKPKNQVYAHVCL